MLHVNNQFPHTNQVIKAKKCFGQNFLFNTNILQKIANLCGHGPVVEIGPGKGYLTKFLLNQCSEVLSIEIDTQFTELLNNLKKRNNHFNWILQDALQVNWSQYASYTIVGNLPYNIATKIILDLCKARAPRCLFVIQEEVAQRIGAMHSTKEYSSLSVMIQAFYDVKLHFIIGPNNFSPAPKVKSRLIELSIKETSQHVDFQTLSTVVRHAFIHRRKTIGAYFLKQYPQFIQHLDKQLRPENLSVEVYKNLARCILDEAL